MLNEFVIELTSIIKKIIDFIEYFYKNNYVNKLIRSEKKILECSYFGIFFLFVIFAIINIFLLLRDPDYPEIIKIGERVAIFLVTTTALTFTYASALNNHSDKNKAIEIIKSGEYFFRSFLYFIVGMISSIGFRKVIINPSNEFSFLPLLDDLTIVILFLVFIIGFFLLIASGYFFVKGIMSLKF